MVSRIRYINRFIFSLPIAFLFYLHIHLYSFYEKNNHISHSRKRLFIPPLHIIVDCNTED